jgi:uncharacterized protein YbjQ (UPF0145 family)
MCWTVAGPKDWRCERVLALQHALRQGPSDAMEAMSPHAAPLGWHPVDEFRSRNHGLKLSC